METGLEADQSAEDLPAYTAGGKLLPTVVALKSNGRQVRRFWSKTTRREVNSRKRDCWNWTASKDEKGYGQFRVSGVGVMQAHRVAYALGNGRWPRPSMMILHSCDNPSCVNPAHLREGTASENQADILARGRHASQRDGRQPKTVKRPRERIRHGSEHWRPGPVNSNILRGGSKLSEWDVRAIRAEIDALGDEPDAFDREIAVGMLALKFEVTAKTIDQVARRVTFAWLV